MRKLLLLPTLAALVAGPSALAGTNPVADVTPVGAPSLSANKTKVEYGGAVVFSGSVPVTKAGEKVTLRAEVLQPNGRRRSSAIAETTTDGAGAFTFTNVPTAQTSYTAVWQPLASKSMISPAVLVRVAPRIGLALVRKVGQVVTFSTKATSAIPYLGRYVLVQRREGLRQWVPIKRVVLGSNAVATRTAVPLPPGLSRVRVFMSQSQVGTGFTPGFSRVILVRL